LWYLNAQRPTSNNVQCLNLLYSSLKTLKTIKSLIKNSNLRCKYAKADGIGQQCTATIGDHMSLSEEKRV